MLVGRKRKYSRPLDRFEFETKRLNCLFETGKLFYLEYNLRLLFFLLSTRFDGVCAIDLDTLVPAAIVSRLKGKKLGYDAHEYFTEVPEVAGRSFVKSIWNWVARVFISKTHFRYTVGEQLATELDRVYGLPFHVVRNVPVMKPKSKQDQENDKVLLYQGALNEGRGLETLIEAATQLPIRVWLVGEGDLSGSLRAMTKRLGLDEKVFFLGFITPEELWSITQKAYLGYNLLENKGKSYYLSLANKYFDYTMAGVPCLVSPFPEYQALQKKFNHSIFCDLKPFSIIEQVNALLNDPNRYRDLTQNCLLASKELNWEKEEQELFKIYDGVFRQ